MSRRPNIAKLQAQCDAFNAEHPVGTRVMLKKDFAPEPIETRTRSEAQVLSGHSAVIWLEGVSGCYALDCVRPIAIASGALSNGTPIAYEPLDLLPDVVELPLEEGRAQWKLAERLQAAARGAE